jgi:hypothetical protein
MHAPRVWFGTSARPQCQLCGEAVSCGDQLNTELGTISALCRVDALIVCPADHMIGYGSVLLVVVAAASAAVVGHRRAGNVTTEMIITAVIPISTSTMAQYKQQQLFTRERVAAAGSRAHDGVHQMHYYGRRGSARRRTVRGSVDRMAMRGGPPLSDSCTARRRHAAAPTIHCPGVPAGRRPFPVCRNSSPAAAHSDLDLPVPAAMAVEPRSSTPCRLRAFTLPKLRADPPK